MVSFKSFFKNRLRKVLGIQSLEEMILKQSAIINDLENQLRISSEKKDILAQESQGLARLKNIEESLEIVKDNLENPTISISKLQQIGQNLNLAYDFFNEVIEQVTKNTHKNVFWGDRMLTLDKSMGFWQDQKFVEAYRQIVGSIQYDQYDRFDGIAWRLHTLIWAAKTTLNLPGDLVECGVFKGDMSWVIAHCLDFNTVNKTLYLYDTFEGFSDQYSSSEDFVYNPSFFDFANQIYRIPKLYDTVKDKFKMFDNIKVIQGVLPDILDQESPTQISFLHIDLNSPAAEVGVLDYLFDKIVPGGIVIFDDYGWSDFKKQKEQEDQWMSQRGYHILELPTGQGLVVKQSK